jgi:hypothetical protein
METSLACIGEPISWLRLEQLALGDGDAATRAHLDACPACKGCLDEIRGDLVALPPLVVPERKRALRWWHIAAPALAAAAIAIVVLRPAPPPPPHGETLAGVKGVGTVVVGLVRERGGAIRDDVATFAPGDRWKIVVTCTAAGGAWLDVAVTEAGANTADHPLAPAHVACGNDVAMPGAFTVTGTQANEICVRVAADPDEPGERACVTVLPE